MVFVTEGAHGNGELSKLDSRLFRQQKGLTKDCISQIGSFLDGWTVIDYNERNDGIPSKTFKSEDTCMMNRGALELAAGREV